MCYIRGEMIEASQREELKPTTDDWPRGPIMRVKRRIELSRGFILATVFAFSHVAGCFPCLDRHGRAGHEQLEAHKLSPPYSERTLAVKAVADSVAHHMYGDNYTCHTVLEGKTLFLVKCSPSSITSDAQCPYGCVIAIKKRNLDVFTINCFSANFIVPMTN